MILDYVCYTLKRLKKGDYRVFFSFHGELCIPVLPIDVIVKWDSMMLSFKNCKYIIDISFIIKQPSITVIPNPPLFMISHENVGEDGCQRLIMFTRNS